MEQNGKHYKSFYIIIPRILFIERVMYFLISHSNEQRLHIFRDDKILPIFNFFSSLLSSLNIVKSCVYNTRQIIFFVYTIASFKLMYSRNYF